MPTSAAQPASSRIASPGNYRRTERTAPASADARSAAAVSLPDQTGSTGLGVIDPVPGDHVIHEEFAEVLNRRSAPRVFRGVAVTSPASSVETVETRVADKVGALAIGDEWCVLPVRE